MAAKKKDTHAGYDRWDTFTGTIKGTGKPLTETQKAGIAKAKKEQAAYKKKQQKKK